MADPIEPMMFHQIEELAFHS